MRVVTGLGIGLAVCCAVMLPSAYRVQERFNVWCPDNVPLYEREAVARRLVPIRTKQGQVRRILGEPTRTIRFHGPLLDLNRLAGLERVGDIDEFCDYYDFTHGDYVVLVFDGKTNVEEWSDRPLMNVWSGNKDEDDKKMPRLVPSSTNETPGR